MAQHKFKVGDIVVFVGHSVKRPSGPYEVVRLMPADSPDNTYRIKSRTEHHERVVREHEIAAEE
ncbi:hypothetical protein [Labrys wisconsinensis]|uniref:DUF1918 domain-containing protein n=1 Tax=Labrys wisconsinensis TaxID=425677 RepID=A0ABU0JGG0_9HYPH|nr:hypothetical protein [Labrys wisconsinensis]MDQ0473373.1 hypothetical protein [Labrys wisconsinensis]